MTKFQALQREQIRQLSIRLHCAQTYRRVLGIGADSSDVNVQARLRAADVAVEKLEQELKASNDVSNAKAIA